jgi:hypothetical protein
LAGKPPFGRTERRPFFAKTVKTRAFPGIIAAMFIIKK